MEDPGRGARSAAGLPIETQGGTASDHLAIGFAHIRRAVGLKIFGPGDQLPTEPEPTQVEDDEDMKPTPPGIILPTFQWKENWDMVILIFILYSAVTVPYRICFDADAEGLMFIYEQVVTFSFIVDVCFNFNQAYMEDDMWVTDRGAIATRYLQGWFWIDAPSSVPVEMIDLFLAGDSSTLGMLRFLRLFRLLRLLKLLNLGDMIAALEIKYELNLTFVRIFTMVINMVFLAHMLGCFWFYMASIVGIDPEITTWVSTYDGGSALYAEPIDQYLYSLYWALTTLTTVGYGDITPSNNLERKYTLFALLVGALVFGFMLSSIGSLVAALDRQSAISEERMDEIKEYMRWRKLPRDLVIRMNKFYTYFYTQKTAFDEQAILGNLTPALRLEVVTHALKETIGKIPLFANTLDPLFQMEVFPLFGPVSASVSETIFAKGDASHALFFLIKGDVEVVSGVDGRSLYRIRPGEFFGESVLTGRRRSATHRALTMCEMLCISGADLAELFAKHPREGRLIHSAVLREHMRKEKMRNLSLRLLVNKIVQPTGGGPPDAEAKRVAAAVRFQIAWNRICDSRIYKVSEFDANASAEDEREVGLGAVMPDRTPTKGVLAAASGPGDGEYHVLASKLDRLEKLIVPLLAKLEVASPGRTPTAPTSERRSSSKMKLKLGRGESSAHA